MTLIHPWWLLALPVVWLFVVFVVRTGRPTVPLIQHRWAVVARVLVVSLLIVAASQPTISRSVDRRTVLFLVDRSASIDAEVTRQQDSYLAAALDTAEAGDIAGVVVFGANARVDQALSAGRSGEPIRTVIDPSATALGSALRSSASLLPTEGSRRMIVLTDVVETSGSARDDLAGLVDAGIAVDVVVFSTGRGPDALIESIGVPPAVRAGDRIPVEVIIRSNQAGPAELIVTSGDQAPFRVPVELAVGATSIEVEVEAETTGALPVQVEIASSFDTLGENDGGAAITRVLGPPLVAIVEGHSGEGDRLSSALEAADIRTEILQRIPNDTGLLAYDAIVLVNLPAPEDSVTEALASFVQDLGRGLVVIGGDQSFGMGGYQDTVFEDLLPVQSNPDDLVRRQPVAEVLAIDTSGSMGNCHCVNGIEQPGVNKTDISRAGAALAIDALNESDKIGVIAFSSGVDWVIPLDSKPEASVIKLALGSLVAQGDTEIQRALEAALEALRTVEEDLRHIVLFTDGWDPNEDGLLPIVRQIADEGITLSVLATGEGPGTTLQRMADIGGGRYYPGNDLDSIPEIFVEETLTVARPLILEGSFIPALGALTQVTRDLESAPPLAGYVLTKSKGSASLPLTIGPNDPLLASWQRGLGRVSAWTSDATSRWSADWVVWEAFPEFWGAVVRDVLPSGRDTPPDLRLVGGTLEIGFAADGVSLDAGAVARVRQPDGSLQLVPLGRDSEAGFSGRVEVSQAGAYWVSVVVEQADAVVASGSGGAVAGFEEEFAFRDPDPRLASMIAGETGGRLNTEADEAFAPAPTQGKAAVALWPTLLLLALLLFLADVTLRRLVFSDSWLQDLKPHRRDLPEATPQPELETVGRLLRRKRG